MFLMVGVAIAAPCAAQTPTAPKAISAPVTPSPAALEIAAKLFPDGTYRKMLGPSMTQMMSGMSENVAAMPLGPFLKAAGLPESDVAKIDKTSLGEIMAIVDPNYKERMRRMMDGMFAAMIPVMEKLEPDLRAGLAESLQSRFSTAQLADLRTFFATPTGGIYASEQMLLFMDPAVMGRMQAAMPKLMETMPAVIAQVAKSDAELPKQKSYEDLTPEDRAKLSKLLGVAPPSAKK